jgi:hypothetical protein
MAEQRNYQGHVYTRNAPGEPWVLSGQTPPSSPAPGGVYTLPQSPQAQRDEGRKDAGLQMEMERLRLAQQQAALAAQQANKPPAGYRLAADGKSLEPIPGGPADPRTLQAATKPTVTAKERADAIQGYQSGASLDRLVADLRAKYAAGPGATKGVYGVQDYFPTEANKQFDSAANAARGIVGTALGFTGGQLNTATESEASVGPYLPQAGDRDDVIADKINRLSAIANDARSRSVAILGGIPDANGVVTPMPAQPAQNAMSATYLSHGDPMQAAGNMATTGAVATPKPMQAEYDAYMAQNARNLDPNDYVRFRIGLDQKYGYPADAAKADEYRSYAERARAKGQQGGTINTSIPSTSRPLSSNEQQRNNLVSNPEVAALLGALDTGGFGGVSALAPDKMAAMGDEYALPMALGQIGGSIGGTAMLGKLGKETFGRVAPALMRGGKMAQAGRNLATDAIYSGVYGGNTGQDPLTSAALGAIGSGAGQGVGGAIGAGLRGASVSPVVQALRDRGVRMTAGQTLGGLPKSIEDGMTSLPGVGDLVNARRLEGFQDFNRAAFQEAGAPIGANVTGIREEGINQLLDPSTGAIPKAYDAATAGVTVPLDPQFFADMQGVAQLQSKLPADYAARFDVLGRNRLGPIIGDYTPTPPNMVGGLPQKGVVPANIGADGKVYIGDPGTSHFHVTEKYPDVQFGGATGFVSPEGRYLNREEALDYVNSNGDAVRPSENMGGQLDSLDYREQARVRPAAGAPPPELTGGDYQQAMRGFKASRASAGGAAPGFEQEYRDAVTGAMDALKGQMQRGGGSSVVKALADADKANRLAKTLAAASGAAKNGASTGELQTFSPAQLNTAAYATAKKFRGERPFADLADAGQEVLPSKIPDSGTGRRVAQMLVVPGALGGTGAGVGYVAGDTQQGALTGAVTGALLAIGGTRKGQDLIVKALTGRPDAVKSLGRKIGQHSGLLGSAAVPLALKAGE